MRIKIQDWDVEVTDEIFEYQYWETNIDQIETSYEKAKEYAALESDYPPVLIEEIRTYNMHKNKIIDGAHRIKAAYIKNGFNKKTIIKARKVIKHY